MTSGIKFLCFLLINISSAVTICIFVKILFSTLRSFQLGYFRFDKVKVHNFAPLLITVNYSVANTPDNMAGLLSNAWSPKTTLTETEGRINLFAAENDDDDEVKRFVISTKLDHCKFKEAQKQNILMRVITENVSDKTSNFTCPILKGTKITLNNMLITDTLIPPFPMETRFRLEMSLFGRLENQKKFTILYKVDIYARIKK